MKSPKLLVLAVGTSQTLAYGTTSYLPAILAPSIAASLGLSVSTIFLGLTTALITAAFVGPWAGKWVDTGRGRDVLLTAHTLYCLGLVFLGFSSGLWTMLAAWVILGVGMALGQYEAAFSVLTSYYGKEARPAITGITLIAGFASTICWPLSTLMDNTIGWRYACWVWGLCHLLLVLPLIYSILPDHPLVNHSRAEQKETVPLGPAAGKMTWTFVVLGFLFFVTWFTTGAMGSHLPLILSGMGMSTEQAVGIAALMGPMQVVARFSESLFMKNMHPLAGARMASLFHPIGATLMIVFGSVMAPVFTMLHGAGNGILTIAKGTLPLALFGPNGYGLRQGLLMIPARVGMAAAPFTFGLALVRWGSTAVLLTGSLTFLAGLGLFSLKQTHSG